MPTPSSSVTTFMFVEDDSILNDVFRRKYQEDPRIRLIFATNGKEAEDILTRVQPDVLCTGISMPKVDGLELLKHIQEMGYRFPVIVLSCHDTPEMKVRAIGLGATEYHVKKEETINTFRKVLEKYLK